MVARTPATDGEFLLVILNRLLYWSCQLISDPRSLIDEMLAGKTYGILDVAETDQC
jgi:hypothetical protein